MILQKTCRDDGESSQRMDGAIEDEDATVRGPRVPAFVVHVSRPAEVEETRKDLPIVMMEQEIMEAINHHLTATISGQPGCGKTSQVPQFLMKLAVQSNLVLEVGLLALPNHAVSPSLPLPREWHLSCVNGEVHGKMTREKFREKLLSCFLRFVNCFL